MLRADGHCADYRDFSMGISDLAHRSTAARRIRPPDHGGKHEARLIQEDEVSASSIRSLHDFWIILYEPAVSLILVSSLQTLNWTLRCPTKVLGHNEPCLVWMTADSEMPPYHLRHA